MKLGMVKRICDKLSPFLINIINNKILLKETPADDEEEYHVSEELFFFIADMLIKEQITPETIRLILDEFHDQIYTFGNELDFCIKSKRSVPECKLCISARFVAIDGKDGFIDMYHGTVIDKMPWCPVKTIVYNLVSLFLDYHHRAKLRENTNANTQMFPKNSTT